MRESIRGEQGVEGGEGATAVVVFFTRGRVGIGGVEEEQGGRGSAPTDGWRPGRQRPGLVARER
jgi:hypothetical protein